jgi:hypothetical protein
MLAHGPMNAKKSTPPETSLRKRETQAADSEGNDRTVSVEHRKGEAAMARALRTRTRTKAQRTTQRRAKPDVTDEEEQILRAATLHLMMKHGSLLLATGARKIRIKALEVWIITVTLRYPTGHEGYVGDLLCDGETFTFLTEPAVIEERVQKIADDPEGLRQWDEYRASTLHPGKE